MSATSLIILAGDDPLALRALTEPVWRRLARSGWSRPVATPFMQVFAPTTGRVDITPALDGHGVLVGSVFDPEGRPLSVDARRALAGRGLDGNRAQGLMTEIWGAYLLVRRAEGAVAVLRDPSGALEAATWRKRGVTLVSTSAAAVLDPWLPDDLSIDWDGVAALVARPGEQRRGFALKGLGAIAPGELRLIRGEASIGRQVWRPADVYRQGRRSEPADLRAVVDRSVRALAGQRSWVAEVSGGLDSAIVASALEPGQRARVTAWVNHYVDHPEGDERAYARPVVALLGQELTEVRRRGLRLDAERLALTAEGFRPAINDIDPDYNDDIAARVKAGGAWGSITGQGGDAVFFQMPTPLIALDEIRERGIRFRPEVVHRIARWTRRSLWPAGWIRAWRAYRADRASWDHAWTDDLEGLPPAKAFQISVLAFCQTYQGQAARNREGICLNPLLSQPVMEAGLARSTVDLTWGGRDRAAARMAFADRIPLALIARRSKGELGAYYGEAVADRLPFLRDYLLGGALAEAGLLDPGLPGRLTRETLLWKGGFSDLLSLALTEAWLRRWQARLDRLRA